MQTPISISSYLSSQSGHSQLLLNDLYLPGSSLQELLTHLSKESSTLEFLSLRATSFTPENFYQLFNFLADHQFKKLRCLGLEWNKIGAQGLRGLLELLEYDIEVIDLKNNQIGSDEIEVLKELIQKKSELRVLDLKWNQIDTKDANLLLQGLEKNNTIVVIELSGNKISNQQLININKILDQNKNKEAGEKKKKPMNVVEAVEEIQQSQVIPNQEMAYSEQKINENEAKLNQLEQAMLFEKKMGMENRGRLETELAILRQQDQQRLFRLRTLNADLTSQSQTNVFLKNELQRLQNEMSIVHSTKSRQLEQLEQRLASYQQELQVLEQMHKGKVDNMLKEQDRILGSIDEKYAEQLGHLSSELDMIELNNNDLERDLHDIEQEVIKDKLQREEEIRGYSDSVNDCIVQNYIKEKMEINIKVVGLSKDIERMDNWNKQMIVEKTEKERMRIEEQTAAKEELQHLDMQLKEFQARKNEYQIIIERIKNEKRMQKNAKKKVHSDIKVLEEIKDKKKEEKERKLKLMKEQQENELRDWKIRIDANKDKIKQLEEELKDLHEINLEMKQDYGRLSDLLQTASTQTIDKAFQDNKYF